MAGAKRKDADFFMENFFIDPVLHHGAPEDMSGRLPKEQATYVLLEKLGIDFHRVDHDAAQTIEQCQPVDELLGTKMCKNLFLCNRQKTQFYLLLMPGEKPFHTKDLSAQIQSARLSFAGAEELEACLNLTPGSVTVLGLQFDTEQKVRLLIDRDLLKEEFLGCHPCINTSSLRIRTADVLEKFLPAVDHTVTYVTL